ncbi:uncharacterized protein VNE69_01029 [Vairimorpha necatrix]|uniref:DUF5094 domain-containing protein n=1 Tax=Vairimorpha necatrix TaxID=6039 RepID=A0AAX4J7X8_9MICR
MKTPKKRMTLKTPKRSTKATFKSNDHTKGKKEEVVPVSDKIDDPYKTINELEIDIKNTEKDLINSLQKENELLRSTNLYVQFLGLDISQVGDKYVVKYNSDKDNRFLHFELVPEEDMFVYSLVNSENIDELGVLGDEISFEKGQIAKFFYKVMEIMISD